MSLEAIKTISEAEESARQIKAEAAQEARRILERAQADGLASIEAAEKKAAAELRELQKKADEKVMTEAQELAKITENKKATMLARAEARLASAAVLVVERIVSG